MAAAVATRSTRSKRASSKSMSNGLSDEQHAGMGQDATAKQDVANTSHKKSSPAAKAEPSDQAIDPSLKPQGTAEQGAAQNPEGRPGLQKKHSHSLEPNPFEQSFGVPQKETPGKTVLPPVAALASPSIQGVAGASFGPWDSLRSGPLSPAMLTGPTTSDLYGTGVRGYPTPNESSLRTGLTPGGGGSMFPAPSPNTQALFNSLAGGGTTPGTLDFQRTAMSAHRLNRDNMQAPQFPALDAQIHDNPNQTQPEGQDPYGHDGSAADAAEGLYRLAQANRASGAAPASSAFVNRHNGQASQNMMKQAANNRLSRNSNANNGAEEQISGESDDQKTASGKKTRKSRAKGGAAGRRKAEDSPTASKQTPKRMKQEPTSPLGDDDEEMEDDTMIEENHPDGRKMTDEEKRKNFLERNRVAALKCRQRKKQWLANLQAKVEIFSTENDALSAQVTSMREEIVNLKTLLIAHKECPIGQAQGLGTVMSGLSAEFNGGAGPQHPSR